MKPIANLRAALAAFAVLPAAFAGEAQPGRFLYANDDDWNWSRADLAYPAPSWSALDWLEEGLSEIRGLVIGSREREEMFGKADELPRQYESIAHEPGQLASSIVKAEANVIALMRITHGEFKVEFNGADLIAIIEFVRDGGRLLVLDDWGVYRPLLEAFLEPIRFEDSDPDEWFRKADTRSAVTGGSGVPSEEMDALLEKARLVDANAESREFLRNSQHTPGRALLLSLGSE